MPPLQRARLLALLALCLSLGQAKDPKAKAEEPVPEDAAAVNATVSGSPSPPGAGPPLLPVALGALAALLPHLR